MLKIDSQDPIPRTTAGRVVFALALSKMFKVPWYKKIINILRGRPKNYSPILEQLLNADHSGSLFGIDPEKYKKWNTPVILGVEHGIVFKKEDDEL